MLGECLSCHSIPAAEGGQGYVGKPEERIVILAKSKSLQVKEKIVEKVVEKVVVKYRKPPRVRGIF